MTRTFLIFPLMLLLSCNGEPSDNEQTVPTNKDAHGNHQPYESEESKHESANEHMHRSSVDELITHFESPERDEYQQPEKVIDYLGNITGKKIMDIGAGSGYFSVKLAEKGAYVIAADVNEEFQQFVSERIQKNNLDNIEPRKIPYDDPGLKNQEVDMIFIVNTYHHIENRPVYFSKAKNGLRENGELIIIDFFDFETPVGPKHHKVSIDKVIDELKKAGFTSFEVEVNLLPYQYIIKSK